MMRMPTLVLSLAFVACTGLAACGDDSVRITTTRTADGDKKVLKVVQTLQCPQTQGSLTRKGTAQAGGTVCTYSGPRGSEVTLHLQPLAGASADEVLEAFEDRLSGDMPRAAAALGDTAEKAETEASSGDRTSVRVPGLSIDTDGESASIRIGGLTINADDNVAEVDIRADDDEESVRIRAVDDGAVVRTRASGGATRASWILTDGRGADGGWRLVGYEARGPVGGPLVIAVVRAKETRREPVFDDARALLALNVGE